MQNTFSEKKKYADNNPGKFFVDMPGSVDREIYTRAVAACRESGKPSMKLLIDQVGVGPTEARRLIDRLEANGIVSAMKPNGGRIVLKIDNTL